MLEIKTTITEMKNSFGGVIRRLDMAEERISEFEDKSIEIPPTKMQKEIT
jgi:hypothetical protein